MRPYAPGSLPKEKPILLSLDFGCMPDVVLVEHVCVALEWHDK